ncbi:MAG TPA: Ig-like domain-containing protein, partial [Isosphaeraceae bacterium]|nr:Ig-like domain-containing protein [Isosphaeraceae bacterium]
GTVSFLLGSTMLATVPLGNDGTATFSTASLPLGTYGITAVYNGAGVILSSRSAAVTESVVPYKQTVNPMTTTTALSIATQSLPHGRTEYVLVATVAPAGGNPPTSPAGIVVFRRNGRTLGKAKIAGGVARIVLGRRRPSSKLTFLAAYQGNSQFRASTSLPYRA